MKIKIYHDFESIPIQEEWDRFIESCNAEISLMYDWCNIWWKYYGRNRSLHIITFREGDELVGILPLFCGTIRIGPIAIRKLALVGTDFCHSTTTIPIKKEYISAVIEKLFSIKGIPSWDIFYWGPICGMCNNYDELINTLQKQIGNNYCIKSTSTKDQTYFMLNQNNQDYLAQLPKKQRRIIKQKYRVLQETNRDKGQAVSAEFATEENYISIFERFHEMHQKHWRSQGKLGHFADYHLAKEFYREVAGAAIKHQRLRLLEVKLGNEFLGYKYAFKFGDKYVEYLDARNSINKYSRAGLGNIIFCEQLKKALQENVHCIDSLTGKYEHKLRMGGTLFPTNEIFIHSQNKHSVMRIKIFRMLVNAIHMLYYNIWFRRIMPRLPFKPRHLWDLWIVSNKMRFL